MHKMFSHLRGFMFYNFETISCIEGDISHSICGDGHGYGNGCGSGGDERTYICYYYGDGEGDGEGEGKLYSSRLTMEETNE